MVLTLSACCFVSIENEVIEETKQSFHKDFSHSFPDQKNIHSHSRQRRSTGNKHKHALCVEYLIVTIKSFKILKYVQQFCPSCTVLMVNLCVRLQWWKRLCPQFAKCAQPFMRSPEARWIPLQPTSSFGLLVWR